MKVRIVLLAVLILVLGLASATQAQPNLEDFETGDFSSLPWSVSYWRVTSEDAHSGSYSVAAYSTSTGVLEVTLTTGAGQVSFWRYSDDSGWLKFYIDGVLTDNWSSMSSTWIEETFPVSAGTHTFRWEASSDGSEGSNDNDVYIDDITFPGAGTVPVGERYNLMGNVNHTDSSSGDYTIGFEFTPVQDITIVAFRSYWGVKMSLWDLSTGSMLTSASTGTSETVWTEVPISPQYLRAGQTYIIAAYTGRGNYYWIDGPALLNSTAGAVRIGNEIEISGDAFPNSRHPDYMMLVDFVYTFPGMGGTAEQSITQDYAIDGDTVTSTVTFGAPITGGTFDLYLTGDFNSSDECYTLMVDGTEVYDECDIGFADDPIATTRGGAHYIGTFAPPSSAIGKTSIAVTGETTPAVNNSNDPAARAWIVIHASPGMGSFSGLEGFERGDFSKFPWQTGGDAPWVITSSEPHSGIYAAKPSTIKDTEKSWLQVTLNIATSGEISFWYKVSSEPDHDFLHFSIDDEEKGKWSGDTGWQQASFPILSGSHTFCWKYAKDGSGSLGKDTAYLDDIAFPSAAVFAPPVQPPAGAGMVLIPAGSFEMGDSFNEGDSDEQPVHTVFVSAFYMDRYEVTKALWDEVADWAAANGYDIGPGSVSGKAADHPVYNVSWYEAVKWCNARSEKEGLTPCYTVSGNVYRTGQSTPDCNWSANGYRLPTEAEWEKAARGKATGHRFPWSDTDTIDQSRANYSSSGTTPVGSFAPNGYGLYDMAGNVWEWCWDRYSSGYYSSSPGTDPRGPASGSSRVERGGSWRYSGYYCHVAYRNYPSPGNEYNDLGFRLVRTAP